MPIQKRCTSVLRKNSSLIGVINGFNLDKNQTAHKKILIVDDQGFNIDALIIILKYVVGLDTDLYVESVLSGIEALEKVQVDIEEQYANFGIPMITNMSSHDGLD